MITFSREDRHQSLRRFETENFDLVIIGGGINGAGLAREAVLRGMKVALVEAHDFASGTSSRSSKLIHGGIRYLENLEFHLVFEALNERTRLFRMAPHLVHPLRFMIPLYKGGRVGMGKMGLGMWLYDALALFDVPEIHERLNPHQSLARQPLLRGDDLLGSFVYSDAYMDDDRLVIETLRAAARFGMAAASYVRAMGAETAADGTLTGVKCLDSRSGKRFSIRGRHVISTVGPWTDELARDLLGPWKTVLRPTKGVHLTFEKKRLPLSSAVVMGAEARIVFGIPRHEMVIVGTTDTDYPGDPGAVTTDPEDVRYLLGVIDQYFPGAQIKASDIVASYSGVRPLVKDDAESEGKTSREHSIWTDPRGVTFVAGGKYTTYRLISEQAIDHCLREAFTIEDRIQFRRGDNEAELNPLVTEESLSFRADLIAEIQAATDLSSEEAQWLVERHGPEAAEILKREGTALTYWQYEAAHAIQNTMCLHLVDFYTRRVPLFLSRADHGQAALGEVFEIFQERLQWSAAESAKELESLQRHAARELAWQSSFSR